VVQLPYCVIYITPVFWLQDIALVVVLAAGNDYLPKTLVSTNLASHIQRYTSMKRTQRWTHRSLVVHDATRGIVAFDAEFLLHFLLGLPEGADQVAIGKATNAHPITHSNGSKVGEADCPVRVPIVNILDRWEQNCLPEDISLTYLASHITDPRILALMDWAAESKLGREEVESLVLHALENFQVCP
jgi:hypothetical protein